MLISFNSYGGLLGITSISEATCNDLQKQAKGVILKNVFGGEFKVLQVKNSKEILRTKDKLVCVGDLKLDSGNDNTKLRMEVSNEDGQMWTKYKQLINFTFDNQMENENSTQNNKSIISRSTLAEDISNCKKIINNDERLDCYDGLSKGVISSDAIIIPSIEKIFKEKKTTLEGTKKLFYGCIYEIKYAKEDVFTGKRKIYSISIGNPEESLIFFVHLGIGDLTGNLPEFEDFYKGDEKGPKIGDCFAFITYDPVQKMVNNIYQPLGIVKIFRGEYKVDEEAVIPALKDKITVDEFFEQGMDYGSKIIKISGKVLETERATNDHWFKIILFSEKFDTNVHHINAYYYSENWKNDESIKNKLLSIKRGDEITLKGLFGGPKVFAYYNGFEVIEILD